MKNRDENTTNIRFSYRTFTIFETFFLIYYETLRQQKSPVNGAFAIIF